MSITTEQQLEVRNVLTHSLRKKFEKHNSEPGAMPFHTRLLGKDRLALYSFIHSLNTNFGTSMFEPVAVIIGKGTFHSAESQQNAGTMISSEAHSVIQKIMDELSVSTRKPNKLQELEEIRSVCQKGRLNTVRLTRVDLKLVAHNGEVYLIDIKTAKPNAGSFKEFKRTLLEWSAASLAIDPNLTVNTLIAIPYNPYAPKPYERWTMMGMLDTGNEVRVAESFWDFLGGAGTYDALLDVFEDVGISMRDEIDDYFAKFKRNND